MLIGDRMTREEASLFFRLVTCRYSRGSILITTSKAIRDWTDLLAGDEGLTAAIIDRLLHQRLRKRVGGDSGSCSAAAGFPLQRPVSFLYATAQTAGRRSQRLCLSRWMIAAKRIVATQMGLQSCLVSSDEGDSLRPRRVGPTACRRASTRDSHCPR